MQIFSSRHKLLLSCKLLVIEDFLIILKFLSWKKERIQKAGPEDQKVDNDAQGLTFET